MGRFERHPSPVARLAAALLLAGIVAGCAAPVVVTEAVTSADAPKPIGPYSQGIKAGGLLFLSAQSAIDPKTNEMSTGSIDVQTKVALDNLSAVLAAAGMTTQNIVNTTVYMKDLNDFAKMNAVYATYFKDKPPARGTVQVAALPRGALVAISAIASR